MAEWALLSIDLDNNVTTKQRNTCYAELKERQWTKLPKLTTVWQVKFKKGISESAIISTTIKDVKAAVAKAGIIKYDAVVHIGSSKPTRF